MTNLVGLIDSDTGKICIMIDPLKVSFFLREKNSITIVVDGARIDYHFTQSSADILQRVIEDANRLNANSGKDGNV